MNDFKIILTISILAGNLFWYLIKYFLIQKKYKIEYFSNHFRDLFSFISLIEKENNIKTKIVYVLVLGSLTISVFFIFLSLYFFITIHIN